MKKLLNIIIVFVLTFFLTIMPVKGLTVWYYEGWQDSGDYGTKTKVTSNITNLKGETIEKDGMKTGPYNKASKAKLNEGIVEEVYVGLNKDNYNNQELFELSIGLNQQEDKSDPRYLTEAVVMTQKSGDNFVLTANWAKGKNQIATINKDGVYTYKWEFKKENDNKIMAKFTVLDYEEELGTTDFVELKVDNPNNATDVRYLWACNIKASYGVDIYTSLPKRINNNVENPKTSDINLPLLVGLISISSIGLGYTLKRKFN